jgi:hypothetical protein
MEEGVDIFKESEVSLWNPCVFMTEIPRIDPTWHIPTGLIRNAPALQMPVIHQRPKSHKSDMAFMAGV